MWKDVTPIFMQSDSTAKYLVTMFTVYRLANICNWDKYKKVHITHWLYDTACRNIRTSHCKWITDTTAYFATAITCQYVLLHILPCTYLPLSLSLDGMATNVLGVVDPGVGGGGGGGGTLPATVTVPGWHGHQCFRSCWSRGRGGGGGTLPATVNVPGCMATSVLWVGDPGVGGSGVGGGYVTCHCHCPWLA